LETIRKAYNRLRFQTKIIILTSILILSIFIVLSIYIQSIMANNIEEEIGEKALAVSNTIAHSPEIIDAFSEPNPEDIIQPYTEVIQDNIKAEFIVIGNKDEIRYAHPVEERIGKRMVGEDNARALIKGESYVSIKEGSLGFSIRGKSPIIVNNEIIGVVSVGYLLTDIEAIVHEKNKPIIILFIIFLTLGIIGSVLIGKHIKNSLFNMEPYEIAELLLQKETILQSTKEGIIAVDTNNKITVINDSAKSILQLDKLPEKSFINEPLHMIVDLPLLDYANDQNYIENREFILNNEIVLLNVFSLKKSEKDYGAVATFRKKTELEEVTQELSMIKQYTDGLRSQAHEFSNKIHTIFGLLQLDQIEEAIAFIKEDDDMETMHHQVIMSKIHDPVVQGLLIAKYNQANEKGITFEVSTDSQLSKITSPTYRDVILKVLGNIIDNAFYAVEKDPIVTLFITDIGYDVIIEVDDNGPGIDPTVENVIFENGYSTKSETGHGTGLYLVNQSIQSLGGHIFLEESQLNGAHFVIIIPKERGKYGEF